VTTPTLRLDAWARLRQPLPSGLAVFGWGGRRLLLSSGAHQRCDRDVLAGRRRLFSSVNLMPWVRVDRAIAGFFAPFGGNWPCLALILPPIRPDGLDHHDGDAPAGLALALFTVGGVLAHLPSLCRPPVSAARRRSSRAHTVTSGIYRHIRHPSYLGLLVGALGWSLAFRSWLVCCLMVLRFR